MHLQGEDVISAAQERLWKLAAARALAHEAVERRPLLRATSCAAAQEVAAACAAEVLVLKKTSPCMLTSAESVPSIQIQCDPSSAKMSVIWHCHTFQRARSNHETYARSFSQLQLAKLSGRRRRVDAPECMPASLCKQQFHMRMLIFL